MSCGVGHIRSSNLALLWLWCRPGATAPIQPLAWEPQHVTGETLKRKKKNIYIYIHIHTVEKRQSLQ